MTGHECCGTSYYDTDTQTCCGHDFIYGNSPRVADGLGSCCGSHTYDASSEICCPLPTGGMQSHSVGQYGVMLQETECCGDGWVNTTTHICCQVCISCLVDYRIMLTFCFLHEVNTVITICRPGGEGCYQIAWVCNVQWFMSFRLCDYAVSQAYQGYYGSVDLWLWIEKEKNLFKKAEVYT